MLSVDFLDTYWGMYLVQCLGHSAIAAVVADSSLLAWHIGDPVAKQRIRLVIIIAPVIGFPLYQFISPERGSMYFRLGALLDLKRWLYMDVFGFFTLWGATLAVIAFTSLVFLIQEVIPMVMHMAETFRAGRAGRAAGAGEAVLKAGDAPETSPDAAPTDTANARVDEAGDADDSDTPTLVHHAHLNALDGLPLEGVDVVLVEDDGYVLFSTTGRSPEIYVSRGIMDDFTSEELRAAVAHELGHIRRSRKPVLVAVYLLRVLQFFNPITLIEFRKVAQEEEKICDDVAVGFTGDPDSLASAIERMRPDMEALDSKEEKNLMAMAASVEAYGHDMLLGGRVNRLKLSGHGSGQYGRPYESVAAGGGWPQFLAVLAVVAVLNYFIV